MGFIDDINFIMSSLIHEHQMLFFSATMPEEIGRLVHRFLKDPVRVELNKERAAPQSLAHHFQYTERPHRLDALIQYLKQEKISQAIIFCNSRHRGEALMRELENKFKSIGYIHGGLEQPKRTALFERFRQKRIDFLVATDLTGRGLDFNHVSHVINYDYPYGHESYTHRTGRTGRLRQGRCRRVGASRRSVRRIPMLAGRRRMDRTITGIRTI